MKLTQDLFESLENEMNEASERLKNVQSAIKVLQNLCEHEWKESPSHGHASEYYCSICNISKSEIRNSSL